jgi:H+/Cl- antiporter ClcA
MTVLQLILTQSLLSVVETFSRHLLVVALIGALIGAYGFTFSRLIRLLRNPKQAWCWHRHLALTAASSFLILEVQILGVVNVLNKGPFFPSRPLVLVVVVLCSLVFAARKAEC